MPSQIALFADQPEKDSSQKTGVGKLAPISSEELNSYLYQTGASVLQLGDAPYECIFKGNQDFPTLFYKGELDLLKQPCVSIVGTRKPSAQGIERAKKISQILVDLGYVVISGLAEGIDTAAHTATLESNGKTVAVLGTPINKIYPAKNKALATQIFEKGLVLSPALPHEQVGRYLFPRRNKLMATLSQATIIIEAGPTSGVVHQAAECLRQKKKLIFLKALAENPALEWVPGFLKSGAVVIETPAELKAVLAEK